MDIKIMKYRTRIDNIPNVDETASMVGIFDYEIYLKII